MKETAVTWRNAILKGAYTQLLKPVLFRCDPEKVHEYMTRVGVFLGDFALTRGFTRACFGYEDPILEQKILGIIFKNPVGLSAGFDKNAELTDILPAVGFGFAEVGSVTGNPCPGNPKPRLWRLVESQGLGVYYGLKNDGCEVIDQRLKHKQFRIPIGVSVAMTNSHDTMLIQNAIADYAKAFRTMEPAAAYLTLNVSCPNTRGGQPFIEPHNLEALLTVIDGIQTYKPIFVKVSPDLSFEEIDRILHVIRRHRIHGIICTNLTKKRDNPTIVDQYVPSRGGFSGKIVQESSDRLLAYVYSKEKNLIIIGSGGIFTAEDAYRKIRLGASLVQMITGMVFGGPQVISEINSGLVRLLKRDGFSSVHHAIGVDNPHDS